VLRSAHPPKTIPYTTLSDGRRGNQVTVKVQAKHLQHRDTVWAFNAKATKPNEIYPARQHCSRTGNTLTCLPEVGDPTRDHGVFFVWVAVLNESEAVQAAEVANSTHFYKRVAPPHIGGVSALAWISIRRP
jgi:hypothetical protein